jgi:predicted neuraminidase
MQATPSAVAQVVTSVMLLMAGAARSHAAEAPPTDLPPGVMVREFIYDHAPFPSCHASTICQLPDGRLAVAFFGGSDEGESDVGIWFSTNDNQGGAWTAPVEVATGATAEQDNRRFPCWNPVLFQPPGKAPLMLFYKVGPRPDAWWGMLKTSADGGRTWSEPRRLGDGIIGPVKNKPVLLKDGVLLCGSSTEHDGWTVHMERTPDLGKTWEKSPTLNEGRKLRAIQPTILLGRTNPPELRILCRTEQGRIGQSTSSDGGKTWEPLSLTELPNPDSGIDAVTLSDGRHVLIFNPTTRGRSPLSVGVSDDGKSWKRGPDLETEPGEYSYPAVIQTSDGKVHVTYTWKRQKIRHVVLDAQKFALADLPAVAR